MMNTALEMLFKYYQPAEPGCSGAFFWCHAEQRGVNDEPSPQDFKYRRRKYILVCLLVNKVYYFYNLIICIYLKLQPEYLIARETLKTSQYIDFPMAMKTS